MGSLDVLSTRIGTINGPRVGRRGNVLECASALALLWMRRQGTGLLQDSGLSRRRLMPLGSM